MKIEKTLFSFFLQVFIVQRPVDMEAGSKNWNWKLKFCNEELLRSWKRCTGPESVTLTLASSFSSCITLPTSCAIKVSLTLRPRSVRISQATLNMNSSYALHAYANRREASSERVMWNRTRHISPASFSNSCMHTRNQCNISCS